MRKFFALAVCMLLLMAKSFGQPYLTNIYFKSPEVSAFNRSIETPVSVHTGIPNISIPLYEINIKGVTIPIVLNYQSGGIKVDQEATWVGLGWTLDYGGQISRKVRGTPDEEKFMVPKSSGESVASYLSLPPPADNAAVVLRTDNIRSAKFGGKDYMPDEFYYSAVGSSGKMMFSQELGKFITFPKEDIAITSLDDQKVPTINSLYTINMKLPNGLSVDFGDGTYVSQNKLMGGGSIINSWPIKKVANNYSEEVNYSYQAFRHDDYKLLGATYSTYTSTMGGRSGVNQQVKVDKFINNDNRLKVISFPGGTIEFQTTGRSDMENEKLAEIIISDKSGVVVKRIEFQYSYFYGNKYDMLDKMNPVVNTKVPASYKFERLKLDGITITGKDHTAAANYRFNYYENMLLPSKFTYSQDHWGFYNGIPNAQSLSFIPNFLGNGGDRRVSPYLSKAFSLRSIVYPEGGKSEFVYENNTANIEGIPRPLLSGYQDENLEEKSAGIAISSHSRNSSYPEPDFIDSDGNRVFYKTFTIPDNGYPYIGLGWRCGTNFGLTTQEANMPQSANNANFKLEKYEPSGYLRYFKDFNTTQAGLGQGAPIRKGDNDLPLVLEPGTYRMTVTLTYNIKYVDPSAERQPYHLGFTAYWRELNPTKKMVNVGGIRIKDINYYDNKGLLSKKKSFDYTKETINPVSPVVTSGKIVSFPKYFNYNFGFFFDDVTLGGGMRWGSTIQSNSVLPLETSSGAFLGYEYVNEYDIDFNTSANNLKTNYFFSFTEPYFGKNYPYLNLATIEPNEWKRGKLLSKKLFNKEKVRVQEDYTYYDTAEEYISEINTDLISFQYIKSIDNGYSDLPDDFYDSAPTYFNSEDITNYKGNGIQSPLFSYGVADYTSRINYRMGANYLVGPPQDFRLPYFMRQTGLDKLKSKTITTYDDDNKAVVQTEDYYYQNNPKHNQLGKTISISSNKDTLVSESKYPLDLILTGQEEAARTALITKHQLDSKLSQITTKNGKKEVSTIDYQIDMVTGYVLPNVSKTNSGKNGADEIRIRYSKFDEKGNLLAVSKEEKDNTVYVWGYGKQYAIAEIKNSDYNTVESVLGGIDKMNAFTSQPSPSDAIVGAFLAPLRTDPLLKDAMVTSYTYKPLAGMTSMTDPRQFKTFYVYDDLLRLSLIKDHKGNIVKRFEYNYAPGLIEADRPKLSLTELYFNSLTFSITLPGSSTTSCMLKYIDLSTSQEFQTNLQCSGTLSQVVSLPLSNRTYRFTVIQKLSDGSISASDPFEVYVPEQKMNFN
ncbi:hypothetical protein SAMN05421820_101399 [Pedobacter steynii]|uniref:YD repeat-containing protein n=1 Tax=Pedobacter steynii TaxID=430522 RepID=A0A1G9JXT2_9SPHI|nr:hypothetical protein [Pedobacter steynii]NQX38381.1 hypothetical protein [Pedobacter steynii]SDL42026.1 hypothetical protein SAMN05421820_101399 [Pedobacter steynii]